MRQVMRTSQNINLLIILTSLSIILPIIRDKVKILEFIKVLEESMCGMIHFSYILIEVMFLCWTLIS